MAPYRKHALNLCLHCPQCRLHLQYFLDKSNNHLITYWPTILSIISIFKLNVRQHHITFPLLKVDTLRKSSDYIWQFCSHSGLLWGFSFLEGMIGAMLLIIHFLVVSTVLLNVLFVWRIFCIKGYITLLIQMTDGTHDNSNAFGIKHSWWQFCS